MDFVVFDVCARLRSRASTLPHREWLSLSIHISISLCIREIHIESICFSLFLERERYKREIDISHFRKYSSVFSGSGVQHCISEK